MFTTTGLSHRVFLTVLSLLLTLALGRPQQAAGASVSASTAKQNDSVRDERVFRSVPLTQASDHRSPYDSYPVSRYEYSKGDRRSGMAQGSGMSTVVSSGSFTIAPDKAGSSVTINAKPVPFSPSNNVDHGGFKKAVAQAHRIIKKKGEQGYTNGNPNLNDCFFGKNCPQENPIDDWRTYYSVLNGLDKPYPSGGQYDQNQDPFNRRNGFGDDEVFPVRNPSDEHSAYPFVISGNTYYRNQASSYPLRRYPDTTRRSRTTTPSSSSPSWVKLEPVLPAAVYDPFAVSKINQTQNETSQFASRVGVELNPESFAERHGWKEEKQGSGTRLPSWLEELNYQHGGLAQRPPYESRPETDRNDEKWVKLEAVPVAGVSISKWVPKGTSPAELPSTNWPEQNNKPSAWWDRMDNFGYDENYAPPPRQQPTRQRPSYSNDDAPWPYTPERPQQNNNKHHHQHSSSGWEDVIYPDNNPASATASWTNDKDGPSGSWPSNYNGNKNPNRYPVASWSASGTKASSPSSNNQYLNSYLSHSRRPSFSGGPPRKPPFYPDPNSLGNDPRWVLVSSSKGPHSNPKKPNINYDPDFPYPYQTYRHRQSKDMNLTNILSGSTHRSGLPLSQDELFRRTNATLSSLRPVLGQRQFSETTEPPTLSQALVDIIAQSGANVVAASTEKYFYKDRSGLAANSAVENITTNGKNEPQNKRRQFLGGINPMYAAVGVGMIPATLAAVLPVALGRKKRYADEIYHMPDEIILNRGLTRSSNPALKIDYNTAESVKEARAGVKQRYRRNRNFPQSR